MIVRLIPKVIKREIIKPYLTIAKLKPYLVDIGWIKSIEQQSAVDRGGNPIPWFTYSMIKCLDKKIKSLKPCTCFLQSRFYISQTSARGRSALKPAAHTFRVYLILQKKKVTKQLGFAGR